MRLRHPSWPAEKVGRVPDDLTFLHAGVALHLGKEDPCAVGRDARARSVEPYRVGDRRDVRASIPSYPRTFREPSTSAATSSGTTIPLRPASATSTVLPRDSAWPDSERPTVGSASDHDDVIETECECELEAGRILFRIPAAIPVAVRSQIFVEIAAVKIHHDVGRG